jgi:hypothetical protein
MLFQTKTFGWDIIINNFNGMVKWDIIEYLRVGQNTFKDFLVTNELD